MSQNVRSAPKATNSGRAEQLVGRLAICVANLVPCKMKFGVSEGLILAAGADSSDIFFLSPDSGAKPAHRVH